MSSYKAILTITKPDNTTVELTILNDCDDCQKALETLLNEATRNPIDINDKIFNREPLLLLVDPDASNIMHLEAMGMSIGTYRKMTSPTMNEYVEYAKKNLMHLVHNNQKVRFVKALRGHFLNLDGSMKIGLKESVDVYNALDLTKYL